LHAYGTIRCRDVDLISSVIAEAVAWSPAGDKLASLRKYARISEIHDGKTGHLIRTIGCDAGNIDPLVWLDDQTVVTSAALVPDHPTPILKVWDIASGTLITAVDGPFPDLPPMRNVAGKIALSPDRTLLAVIPLSITFNTPAILYRTSDWTEVARVVLPGNAANALALSNDRLALTSYLGQLVVFDNHAANQPLVWQRDPYAGISTLTQCLAFNFDGTHLATGSATPRKAFVGPDAKKSALPPADPVRLWHAATGQQEFGLAIATKAITALAWQLGPGTLLAVAAIEGVIETWDIAARFRAGIRVGKLGSPVAMAFSPDGTLLAVSDEDQIALIDTSRSGCPPMDTDCL